MKKPQLTGLPRCPRFACHLVYRSQNLGLRPRIADFGAFLWKRFAEPRFATKGRQGLANSTAWGPNASLSLSWRADAGHDRRNPTQLLQTLLVRRPPGDDIAAQHVSRPTAELNAAARLVPVADRDDDVKVEALFPTGDLPGPLETNLCKICTSSLALEFSLAVDVRDVP